MLHKHHFVTINNSALYGLRVSKVSCYLLYPKNNWGLLQQPRQHRLSQVSYVLQQLSFMALIAVFTADEKKTHSLDRFLLISRQPIMSTGRLWSIPSSTERTTTGCCICIWSQTQTTQSWSSMMHTFIWWSHSPFLNQHFVMSKVQLLMHFGLLLNVLLHHNHLLQNIHEKLNFW